MGEFIKRLFLAHVLLLAGPKDFAPGPHELELGEPISAISAGASLRLDVTNMAPADARSLEASREWIKKAFPPNAIRATLRSRDGRSISLAFNGASSWEPGSIQLIIEAAGGVPEGLEFSSLELATDVPLRQVKLAWANYQL